MGNISKWFDREISLSVGDIIDAKALDNDALHFSEFYVITIYDEKKTNVPVKHRWSKVWTYEMQGHKMYNVFTTFDMALVEYNRQSKEHSNAIMRVERRTLSSLLHGNSYVIKLINVYGDFCYICDGKKAFPEDYWKRWPHLYTEDAKKHEEKQKKPIGFVVKHDLKEKESNIDWYIEDSDAFE